MGTAIGTQEQMKKDYQTITDYTVNGKCSECGSCCSRFLALSNYEINVIKGYIKKHGIQQNKHAVNVYANPLWDYTCPFLDDTKPNHKCNIYEVRPLLCKDFICSKGKKPSPALYKGDRRAVDMVETFFPQNKNKGEQTV